MEDRLTTFWLLPAAPGRERLAVRIAALAERHETGTGAFEPHLTLYAGACGEHDASRIGAEVARRAAPLTLEATRLAHSRLYSKTLFIEFAPTEALRAVERAIRGAVARPSDYVLAPHVSLMYRAGLSEEEKEALCSAATDLLGSYLFDALSVVETEHPLVSGDQVRRWRTLVRAMPLRG